MGKRLLKRAANKSHALAAYSLAIIEFNGSGGSETDKNPRAGIELCMRADSLGHLDAVLELGYLLYDGNCSFPDNILPQAVKLVLSLDVSFVRQARHHQERHPANVFLEEWFESRVGEGLKLCANKGCGRPETRVNEFRRCSVCSTTNYCSRSCHWLDWNLRYKPGCGSIASVSAEGGGGGGGNGGAGA
ncbi:hypothetical protein V6N13_061748 [Hibiscus sabdariffa]|uniref:MYND-type domain-containing protein n=1 Tax=Hibiscus sabdariffa TaxID=183260 RepID=A0ABR2BFV4_9ROSI